MSTPSEALRQYLGVGPSQELIDQEREAKAVRDAARVMALRKATEMSALKRSMRKQKRESEGRHFHPADDPWTLRCRTLCGRIVNAKNALSPRSNPKGLLVCEECRSTLAAWRVFSTKPLTYRRLNSWLSEESMDKKTQREHALEHALEALTSGESNEALAMRVGYGDGGLREAQAGLIVGLIQLECMDRLGSPLENSAEKRRHLMVELVRSGLPPEVLKAIRNA